ncbi:PRD domain-containing protein [Robertmurraya sp. P23]|uniref:PRD domain-containing protein n=1 Tax=Robertmurraya sp. P23 TaxID=3436931 RepID=UPI003D9746BC
MNVIKKVNNNVVLAINDKKEEVFIVGKGLGFKKTPYKVSEEDIIEKIYVAPKNLKMFDLLNDIPFEDISLAEEIIQEGRKILNKELSPNLIITLSDHISFALQRTKEEIQIKNPLQWEVKTLYPEETKVGQVAIDMIRKKTGVTLPQSETTSIALHFVNAQIGSGEMSETRKITKITGDILAIIKYFYKKDFDETSLNFTRFATHIRYFIIRQFSQKSLENENEALFKIVQEKYPLEIKCVEKVEKFLSDNYGWKCTKDEKLYLVLHIQRLTK